MKRAKLILDTDIRRLPCNPTSISELRTEVETAFHLNTFTLKYLDNEGDYVCLENDTDLLDASSQRAIRIYVCPPTQTPHKCPLTWPGFKCCECKSTITGKLCVCTQCPEYCLCQGCELRTDHSHPFVIHTNKQFIGCKPNSAQAKLKMKFVEHCNWKAREVFQPSVCAQKVWKLMNSGDTAWPEGCCLAPAKGDLKGPPTKLPPLRPNEECEVISCVQLPGSEGKYNGTWRVFSPAGVPFGDKLFLVAQVHKNTEECKLKLNQLIAMGFTREDSLRALVETCGNVERALEMLVNN